MHCLRYRGEVPSLGDGIVFSYLLWKHVGLSREAGTNPARLLVRQVDEMKKSYRCTFDYTLDLYESGDSAHIMFAGFFDNSSVYLTVPVRL
jgi:hypothetical protein